MDNSILCPKATKLVDQLFSVFYAICNGFEKQFSDKRKLELAKIQWVIAFMEEKITEHEQIEDGVKKCRRMKGLIYTPTVGDFLSWCEELKIESFLTKEQAYTVAYEYMRGDLEKEISPNQIVVLEHTIKACGRNFLKTNSRSATEPVFYRNYEISLKDFVNGELKPIPKAIQSDTEKQDNWKTLNYYGVLPQYAHLTSRDKAMPVIKKLMEKMQRKNFIGDKK